jgi:hypothetical protein
VDGPEPPYEVIARAAATGLTAHTDVEGAVVSIDGPRHALELRIDCRLADDADVLRTTELIISVRNQLAALLDVSFDTAEMTIRNATQQDGDNHAGRQ